MVRRWEMKKPMWTPWTFYEELDAAPKGRGGSVGSEAGRPYNFVGDIDDPIGHVRIFLTIVGKQTFLGGPIILAADAVLMLVLDELLLHLQHLVDEFLLLFFQGFDITHLRVPQSGWIEYGRRI